jgi:Ca2+:H+ antiporter
VSGATLSRAALTIACPAPSFVRAEGFFLVSAASVAAFALFEDRLFPRLDNPLILTAILLWLFGVVLWSSLSVVRHAESLARRLGEPYGTLLLTLTITSIEVVAISAVVRHGGPNPTLMRDTLLALIMIIMNGMVTIPSVLVINHLIERPVVLGVEHTDLALLILTLALSMITFTSGRTNMLQGVVHLLLFAAYILLIFQA